MKRILWSLLAVIVAGVGFYGIAGRKAPTAAPAKKQPLVAVMPVRRGSVSESLTATGKVEAAAQVDILPKVEQRIVSMPFREGDRVAAGQVLARLDTTEMDRQLDQARAEERVARAVLQDWWPEAATRKWNRRGRSFARRGPASPAPRRLSATCAPCTSSGTSRNRPWTRPMARSG